MTKSNRFAGKKAEQKFVINYLNVDINCTRMSADDFMKALNSLSQITTLQEDFSRENVEKIENCTMTLADIVLKYTDIDKTEIKELDMMDVIAIVKILGDQMRFDPKAMRARVKSTKK